MGGRRRVTVMGARRALVTLLIGRRVVAHAWARDIFDAVKLIGSVAVDLKFEEPSQRCGRRRRSR